MSSLVIASFQLKKKEQFIHFLKDGKMGNFRIQMFSKINKSICLSITLRIHSPLPFTVLQAQQQEVSLNSYLVTNVTLPQREQTEVRRLIGPVSVNVATSESQL